VGWIESPDDEFKSFVYEQFSRLGKVFSSSARLVILNILSQGEHTVEALARHSGLTVANLSRHLQALKSVNMVKMRRSGKYIYYSASDEETIRFFQDFKNFAYSKLAEIRNVLQEISSSPSRLHPVDTRELIEKIKDDEVLIIDVRPEEEYRCGHFQGAISIPLEDLEERIKQIPRDKPIVAYCRGRFCILADKAVEILLNHGYKVRRADDGVVEWKIAGLPVTRA